jgi:hypothetical protein
MLAAGTPLTLPGAAAAAAATPSRDSALAVLTTFETFGVTLLTNAAQKSPGTPSAQFAGVVKAANITEFFHLQALKKLGGRTLAKFWIPDAVLDGGVGLFSAIAAQEEVEISAYLIGVTQATKRRDGRHRRAALRRGARHRVRAPSPGSVRRCRADGLDRGPQQPRLRGLPLPHAGRGARGSEKAGLGFGKQGTKPGKFYDFPGDPRKNGTAGPLITPKPA